MRPQPSGLNTRFVEAGNITSRDAGRRGRATSSPVQFGQRPFNCVFTQSAQNVHSNEQMRAASESGGKSQSQHSQFGLTSSIRKLRTGHKQRHDLLEASLVLLVKPADIRTVEVKHAVNDPALDERNHKLRV